MRWSKLKQIVESRFSESLKGRVELEVTHYRRSHHNEGRWAILVGGRQLWAVGCIKADREQGALIQEAAENRRVAAWRVQAEADQRLRSRAGHTVPMFKDALSGYLNATIEDALTSPDALLRALALLDRRLGKRRLRELARSVPKSEIELRFLEPRLRLEGSDVTKGAEGQEGA